jgi:hypothetical protein
LAIEILHDQVVAGLFLPNVVYSDDIAMPQVGRGSRFAAKALHQLLVRRQMRIEDLDRHRALQFGVVSADNYAHSALPDDFLNSVPPEAMANPFYHHRFLTAS